MVESVRKRHQGIVTVNKMKFGFMPEVATNDAVPTLRRLQEDYLAKGKNVYMLCGLRESY